MTSAGGILLVVLGVWLGLQTMVGALPDKILAAGGTASVRQPPKKASSSPSKSSSSKPKPKGSSTLAPPGAPQPGHIPGTVKIPGLPSWIGGSI